MKSCPRDCSSVSASALLRAQALTFAGSPVAGPDAEVLALAEGDGVGDALLGVVSVADPVPAGLLEVLLSGVSPPPQPAARTPARAIATVAVRRRRAEVVEREVTPRR
ncbi:hypothetical protein JNB_17453 [Janibacter sp. HTCC2649]|nr:hypothetical protein JNB_17453 [Janibacter sp. HTCC2649]